MGFLKKTKMTPEVRAAWGANVLALRQWDIDMGHQGTEWAKLPAGMVYLGEETGKSGRDANRAYWVSARGTLKGFGVKWSSFKKRVKDALRARGLDDAAKAIRTARGLKFLKAATFLAAGIALVVPGAGPVIAGAIMAGGKAARLALKDGHLSIDEIVGIGDAALDAAGVDLAEEAGGWAANIAPEAWADDVGDFVQDKVNESAARGRSMDRPTNPDGSHIPPTGGQQALSPNTRKFLSGWGAIMSKVGAPKLHQAFVSQGNSADTTTKLLELLGYWHAYKRLPDGRA